jgi:hypothetical protein
MTEKGVGSRRKMWLPLIHRAKTDWTYACISLRKGSSLSPRGALENTSAVWSSFPGTWVISKSNLINQRWSRTELCRGFSLWAKVPSVYGRFWHWLLRHEIVLKSHMPRWVCEGFFLYLCILLLGVGHGARRIGDCFNVPFGCFCWRTAPSQYKEASVKTVSRLGSWRPKVTSVLRDSFRQSNVSWSTDVQLQT